MPLGKFNSMIPVQLSIYPENFIMIAATVSHMVAVVRNILTNIVTKVTNGNLASCCWGDVNITNV